MLRLMTLDLVPAPSDEQSMLLEASVRFMESEHPLATVRACADGAPHDDEAYRRTAAELGWFGLLAAEAHGGGSISGNGLLDAALIAAERGARLQPGPFVGHSVVVHALAASGERGDVLDELVRGDAWATWVDGSVVADGAACRWLLVDTSEGAVLVRTDAPGVTLRPLEGLDVTRRWCAVDVDIASVAGDVVDVPVARRREIAAVLVAAESVGAMQADFDAALQYSKDRIAFGRPIGSRRSSTCSPTRRCTWRWRRGSWPRPRLRSGATRPTVASWPTRPRRSSPNGAWSWRRTASRCSEASATRGSTISTSSSAGWRPTPSASDRPPCTAASCSTPWG
jgi:alkylation response protein AidB-like acyl-CoA dehydrogenase